MSKPLKGPKITSDPRGLINQQTWSSADFVQTDSTSLENSNYMSCIDEVFTGLWNIIKTRLDFDYKTVKYHTSNHMDWYYHIWGSYPTQINSIDVLQVWGQLFKKFNLDQNDLDLEISCFAIRDQVTHLTFVPFFQSKIGLDHYTLFQISKSGLLELYGAPKGTWWEKNEQKKKKGQWV